MNFDTDSKLMVLEGMNGSTTSSPTSAPGCSGSSPVAAAAAQDIDYKVDRRCNDLSRVSVMLSTDSY